MNEISWIINSNLSDEEKEKAIKSLIGEKTKEQEEEYKNSWEYKNNEIKRKAKERAAEVKKNIMQMDLNFKIEDMEAVILEIQNPRGINIYDEKQLSKMESWELNEIIQMYKEHNPEELKKAIERAKKKKVYTAEDFIKRQKLAHLIKFDVEDVEENSISQSANKPEIVETIKKLNPNAKIEVVLDKDGMIEAIEAEVSPEELVLPEGFEYNEKNGITNKHNTKSGAYTTIEVRKKVTQIGDANPTLIEKIKNTARKVLDKIKSILPFGKKEDKFKTSEDVIGALKGESSKINEPVQTPVQPIKNSESDEDINEALKRLPNEEFKAPEAIMPVFNSENVIRR